MTAQRNIPGDEDGVGLALADADGPELVLGDIDGLGLKSESDEVNEREYLQQKQHSPILCRNSCLHPPGTVMCWYPPHSLPAFLLCKDLEGLGNSCFRTEN